MATGWNKSLVHRWNFSLNELVSELKKPPTPIGAGDNGGRLRKAFRLSRNDGISTIKDSAGKAIGIRIINKEPYARIRDIGGRIPDRRPIRARVMRWVGAGGEFVFRKFARGYNIPPLNYVQAAVNRFFFNKKNIKIEWN